MGMVSREFNTGSDFDGAWNDLQQQHPARPLAGVRLERQVGNGPWAVCAALTQTAMRAKVRSLDGAPVPGRFRFVMHPSGVTT